MRHPGKGGCTLPSSREVDVLSACPPCQPFSILRSDRKTTTSKQHKLYGTVFDTEGSLVSLAWRLEPGVIVGEETNGFQSKHKEAEHSACDELEQRLRSLRSATEEHKGEPLFLGYKAVTGDCKTWMEVSRDRFFSCTTHESLSYRIQLPARNENRESHM